MPYPKLLRQFSYFVFYSLLFISFDAIARAGGGGNGGSSGGDGGGTIIYLLVRLIFLLPFPLNIIVIGIIIFLTYRYYKSNQQKSTLNTLSGIDRKFHEDSVAPLLSSLPNFNQVDFYKKVGTAFYKIQEAWQYGNLQPVRQFISDGVYQRFEAQFVMMKQLQQTNTITDVKLHEQMIVSVENDGSFHIIHVRIRASNTDYFNSKQFSELNSGGYEEYTEYWTFVKKTSSTHRASDLFNSANCPNCGDSIQNKLGEISKCPSCGTQINNGDYDWILSEITQPEEFASNFKQLSTRNKFYQRIQTKGYTNHEFSPQYIEDKASNAYLQLKIAQALSDRKRINRFCSESFLQKNDTLFGKPYLYNRLYTRDVSLINIYEDPNTIFAALSISCAQQKVTIENNKLQLINTSPVEVHDYLVLSRSKTFTKNQYSAMAHNCSGCGAPVEDSLQLTCHYCNGALNDNKKDWIVEQLLSENEYAQFKQQFNESVNTDKQEQKLEDSNWNVRDFALNNMMVVAMADGVMQEEERSFLIDTAKDLGYNSKKITELFDQIKTSGLALKMPSEFKNREKVLKLMNKVANADGDFNAKEKAVLAEAETMV